MTEAANYLIVQHVPDLFRREPRNVGVFVRHLGAMDAKFFGEVVPGQIDKRKAKSLPHPGVYAQWVRYWRRTLARGGPAAWDEIVATAKDHYRVIDGGKVEGIAERDSIEDVVNYLYAALVSEGGFAEALGARDEADVSLKLVETVSRVLMARRLLALGDGEGMLANVRHPIKRAVAVPGLLIDYTPSFVQEHDQLAVMETLDLSTARDKSRVRERAGATRSMFSDIRDRNPNAETIAIVNATADEEKQDHAAAALRLLQSAGRVFNWQSAQDRDQFLAERERAAA